MAHETNTEKASGGKKTIKLAGRKPHALTDTNAPNLVEETFPYDLPPLIRFEGKVVNGFPMERLVQLGISYVDEKRLIFPSMSVADNLALGAYRRHRRGTNGLSTDMATVFQLFPILEERLRQTAGTLSGGEKQMLAIGRAFMAGPKLLLLDCPSLRLAPILVKKVMGAISELRDHGITTLLVEQNVKAVSHIADRGYFLEKGQVISSGSPQELLSNSNGSRLVS